MICDLCGNEYVSTCMHCAPRIRVWGIDGTVKLYQWGKTTGDIAAHELLEFVSEYYAGHNHNKRDAVGTLKLSLRLVGYKGNFIGRIHRNDPSYAYIRHRNVAQGKRWHLRKDKCELCPDDGNLILHHIVPLSWGGITSPENCITLCDSCHQKTHFILREFLNREQLLKYLTPYQTEIKEMALRSLPDGILSLSNDINKD
jgi:5-methylcytosine-specific restriction endonuclease McrA